MSFQRRLESTFPACHPEERSDEESRLMSFQQKSESTSLYQTCTMDCPSFVRRDKGRFKITLNYLKIPLILSLSKDGLPSCHSEERSDEESRFHVILEPFTHVKDEESQGGVVFIPPSPRNRPSPSPLPPYRRKPVSGLNAFLAGPPTS